MKMLTLMTLATALVLAGGCEGSNAGFAPDDDGGGDGAAVMGQDSSQEQQQVGADASQESPQDAGVDKYRMHLCATVRENMSAVLNCGAGHKISTIVFASYGTPTGACGYFAISDCNDSVTPDDITARCVGNQKCTVAVDSGDFPSPKNPAWQDPCPNVHKWLSVEVACE